MVTMIQFKFFLRYLESDAYNKNHRANRIVVNEFGTMAFPDPCMSLYDKFSSWFKPGNTKDEMTDNCLVNVLQTKDHLLAMTETDVVRIVDPTTLETKPEKVILFRSGAVEYKQIYIFCIFICI